MSLQVVCKASLLCKVIGTEVALEPSLAGVDANMLYQVVLPPEGLLTAVTLVRAFAYVHFSVLL